MGIVEITYLQMLRPPQRSTHTAAPLASMTIERVENPDVQQYRVLYDRVGREWWWVDRKSLSDAELTAIIQHPDVEIHVLRVNGADAGYAELDRRMRDEVEIAYFGLLPEFIGKGLGSWFLDRVVDIAWSYNPKRVWLHTCTLDHPRALPNYIKAGFTPYHQDQVEKSYGDIGPA